MAEGQRCMVVLVGSKHLAGIQGDDAPGRVTEVLLSLRQQTLVTHWRPET